MVELTVRVVFSLTVVLGLLMLCVRVAGRRFQGRSDALVQVVHRQALGRHASVSVVNVSGRLLVLGTTDQEVRLLTEIDRDALEDEQGDTLLTLVADREALDLDLDLEAEVAEVRREQVEASGRPGRHVAPRRADRTRSVPSPGRAGALGGSILSPRTWRQAWGAVTGQAS